MSSEKKYNRSKRFIEKVLARPKTRGNYEKDIKDRLLYRSFKLSDFVIVGETLKETEARILARRRRVILNKMRVLGKREVEVEPAFACPWNRWNRKKNIEMCIRLNKDYLEGETVLKIKIGDMEYAALTTKLIKQENKSYEGDLVILSLNYFEKLI